MLAEMEGSPGKFLQRWREVPTKSVRIVGANGDVRKRQLQNTN
jgi:hypothetical protein